MRDWLNLEVVGEGGQRETCGPVSNRHCRREDSLITVPRIAGRGRDDVGPAALGDRPISFPTLPHLNLPGRGPPRLETHVLPGHPAAAPHSSGNKLGHTYSPRLRICGGNCTRFPSSPGPLIRKAVKHADVHRVLLDARPGPGIGLLPTPRLRWTSKLPRPSRLCRRPLPTCQNRP